MNSDIFGGGNFLGGGGTNSGGGGVGNFLSHENVSICNDYRGSVILRIEGIIL